MRCHLATFQQHSAAEEQNARLDPVPDTPVCGASRGGAHVD